MSIFTVASGEFTVIKQDSITVCIRNTVFGPQQSKIDNEFVLELIKEIERLKDYISAHNLGLI